MNETVLVEDDFDRNSELLFFRIAWRDNEISQLSIETKGRISVENVKIDPIILAERD